MIATTSFFIVDSCCYHDSIRLSSLSNAIFLPFLDITASELMFHLISCRSPPNEQHYLSMGFASIQEKDITRDMDEQHLSLIDSHFHLRAIEAKGIDPIALLQKMQENNIVGLEIGLAGDDLGMRIERFGHYDGLQFAVGIGPWGVDKGRPSIEVQIAQLEEQLDLYKAAAIGEIGLDNHWKYGTPESQEALLHRQFDLAQDRGLPIIIHNREAD